MRLKLLLAIILFGNTIQAQTLYIDPATSSAIFAHSSIIDGQLKKTNQNLTLIERGQLAVTGQLVIVNDLQAKIYKGLTEVAGVIHTLSSIKEIGDIGIDIVSDLNKSLNIAKKNPVLILFAEQGAREFKGRATNLAIEVSTFVVKGGKDNLMNSGERAELLNHITREMRLLRGLAYGMSRAMYWASIEGIWKSINPYQRWINMDVQIANDILRESKYLKR